MSAYMLRLELTATLTFVPGRTVDSTVPEPRPGERTSATPKHPPHHEPHRSVSRRLRDRALIHALYEHGLLHPGDTLVWRRTLLGAFHEAVLTENGRLRPEGHSGEFSPSGAARVLTGASHDGLAVWRTTDGGVSLKELRERLPSG